MAQSRQSRDVSMNINIIFPVSITNPYEFTHPTHGWLPRATITMVLPEDLPSQTDWSSSCYSPCPAHYIYILCDEYSVLSPMKEHSLSKDRGEERRAYAIAREVMEAENRAVLSLICLSLMLPGEWGEAAARQGYMEVTEMLLSDSGFSSAVEWGRLWRLKRGNQNQVSPNAALTRSPRKSRLSTSP